MPIDFNPHISNIAQPYVVRFHHEKFAYNSNKKDVFIKSIDPAYEGIEISKKSFGKIRKTGQKAELYTIKNKNGASVNLSSFGATIVGMKVPDKDGKLVDVIQGYNSVIPYELYPVGHAGGTIGPCANKISNGNFSIGETEYILECNKDKGKSHSHGGSEGFDVQNWKSRVLRDGIEFTYLKQDRESGYPGNVEAKVTYKLDNDNNLHVQYQAKTDKETLLNMTNHAYFNLDGASNYQENSILNHYLKLPNSTKITKINNIGIPNGEFLEVKDTPFDFKNIKRIGDEINSNHEQMKITKGYDHNYCVDGYNGKDLIEIAELTSKKTGIQMSVSSNLPGFQLYTANNLGKTTQPQGKSGYKYEKRSAICIEPQFYPNAINTPNFEEKGVLKPDEEYNREIVYSFSVR